MSAETPYTIDTAELTLRLLNGPLRGCEFQLPPGKTLFVAGAGETLSDPRQMPELPADAIYLPWQEGGVNFEILVGETVTLRELGHDDVAEREAPLNQRIRIGGLELALRSAHMDWGPEVLRQPQSGPESSPSRPLRTGPNRWAWLALLPAIGGLAWLALDLLVAQNAPQRQTEQLSELLGGDSARFEVMQGHDGLLYVAAQNERDRAWARQAALRADFPNPPQVILAGLENERLSRWLAASHPGLAYFRLQLRDPRHPSLWISRQRAALPAPEMLRLRAQLAEQLPYAERVDITEMDDSEAAKQAEAGLTSLALPFRRQNQPDSVTFVISGELEDGALQRVRQFIDGYTRQWGSRYAQFDIELKDDKLKGKSFLYGDQGYVKQDAGHWFFPKTL
ncbi:PrgH/EprH family type III secretion apparatus protein [Chromobacterium sp. IIBBL 290-4]|uniref:PrgH/EprH family type III secretion apparatus protein n=1 Tax=Chromobacterium sp. IIBBL 290-4 TaxID=2953890 RepID=UPI0020B7A34F|nr:PrgH/EprH family type III secretion apparatus protein [Chromobacterium sp. IIBBL 290-4]UTH74114.1 PrgH/EprH family type III secretion apparatus protein [Chromobacterium sp. IIBBL 290-4]